MKTSIRKVYRTSCVILTCVSLLGSCSKDIDPGIIKDPGLEGTDAESVNSTFANLTYDPNELLNVQNNPGTTEINDRTVETKDKGNVFECRTINNNLKSNFQNVVMFDPTLGVIYPGALVIGNRGMLDGAPQPMQVSRSSTKLRVDLPGIAENGNIVIEDPNYQNTQAGIDNALEYWNSEVQPQGYEIDSEAYYEKTTAYSKEQMSLSLGVSAEWAGGSSFESQFDYSKSTEKRVATMLYRQVFYDVVMETPESPASVFASDVDIDVLNASITNEEPPAYVSSVQYGRIIMIRMETTDVTTNVNLEAVLDYATAKVDASAEVNADYEKVIKKSTLNVITIGGNAETASEVITGSEVDEGQGGLNYVISDGSLYSRDNPGAPIGYTIKYLKDNVIAKMGYNTDYSIEQCKTYEFEHSSVDVDNNTLFDVRFRFVYKERDSNSSTIDDWITVNNGKRKVGAPDDGAYNVEVEFQFQDGPIWRDFDSTYYNYVTSKKCHEITYKLWENKLYRNTVSCN